MEQVVLDGITYTKAATVAKQFGYTSDYIGQLCRTGKVRCERVGRSWFVDVSSVVDHRANRHKEPQVTPEDVVSVPSVSEPTKIKVREGKDLKSRKDEKSNKTKEKKSKKLKTTTDNKKYKVEIHPRFAHVAQARKEEPKYFARRIDWTAPRYEPDSGELLPSLVEKSTKSPNVETTSTEKSSNPIRLRIGVEGSKKVTVEKQSEEYQFETTEMPEVPLTGTLRIQSYEPIEEAEDDKKSYKNKDFSQSAKQLQNPRGVIAMPYKPAVKPPVNSSAVDTKKPVQTPKKLAVSTQSDKSERIHIAEKEADNPAEIPLTPSVPASGGQTKTTQSDVRDVPDKTATEISEMTSGAPSEAFLKAVMSKTVEIPDDQPDTSISLEIADESPDVIPLKIRLIRQTAVLAVLVVAVLWIVSMEGMVIATSQHFSASLQLSFDWLL